MFGIDACAYCDCGTCWGGCTNSSGARSRVQSAREPQNNPSTLRRPARALESWSVGPGSKIMKNREKIQNQRPTRTPEPEPGAGEWEDCFAALALIERGFGLRKSWCNRPSMCHSPSKHRHRSRTYPGTSKHPGRPQAKKSLFLYTISGIPGDILNEFSGCTLK